MYSKILVAVDESETSRHALQQAIELAKQLSASVRMVHVLDMSWLPVGPEIAIDTSAMCAARRAVGERILAAARDTAKASGFEPEDVLIETENPIQHVAEAITQEGSRWGAELVVLGTHGRRGFRHFMLGSVAERVTKLSSGPILLIPPPQGSPSA